ncbi:hypothetical protein RND71_032479 [Anisodus tanguticus]|uniref:DUF4283 domain-containing protein n=1 Tax=Anisodus tanguticus TaxID=243964 RepID=A0AAE1RCQ2_9SOLA|nr:hypothetical protein RND71_032479 [Anisodus tanguticus]
MVEQQDLKYAVVGKFSHGMPSIAFLRTAIPKQCSLKAEVNIGLLHNRHVLIRCSIEEDYVTLMSRPNFWIKENSKSFLMRTFKWDIGFTPEEETSMAVIWLSFPNLPPNFYVPSILFSIASAVGRPIAIDAATLNKTRPSCARVKVEADLLQEHPQRYNIQIMNGEEMETMSYKIRYDFLPKYCTTCMLQGHDLQGCWKEHPELQPEKRNHGEDSVAAAAKGKATNPTRPPTNPSRQNPNPKPLPTAPNHSQEWTTVTHKRKKQNTQIQPLELTEKDTPTTETAAEAVLDVGYIASSSKQPILNQILTEIGLLPTETVIPASIPIGKTTSSSNQPISVEKPTGNPTGNYLKLEDTEEVQEGGIKEAALEVATAAPVVTTKQWVANSFEGNNVPINKECAEIPSNTSSERHRWSDEVEDVVEEGEILNSEESTNSSSPDDPGEEEAGKENNLAIVIIPEEVDAQEEKQLEDNGAIEAQTN